VSLRLALAVVAAAALAATGHAHAHGGQIIARAVESLTADPLYVDPTAVPTITPTEADRLRDEIDDAGGRIYVAVLPADAQHELPTARAVVEAVAAGIGGEPTVVVLVGGQLRATSADHPDEVGGLERQLVADVGAGPSARLARFIEGVGRARSDGSSAALTAVGAAAVALALLAAFVVARRRGSLRPGPGRAA
jgi:hypothetical protein